MTKTSETLNPDHQTFEEHLDNHARKNDEFAKVLTEIRAMAFSIQQGLLTQQLAIPPITVNNQELTVVWYGDGYIDSDLSRLTHAIRDLSHAGTKEIKIEIPYISAQAWLNNFCQGEYDMFLTIGAAFQNGMAYELASLGIQSKISVKEKFCEPVNFSVPPVYIINIEVDGPLQNT